MVAARLNERLRGACVPGESEREAPQLRQQVWKAMSKELIHGGSAFLE
jgi:hypothetical protein